MASVYIYTKQLAEMDLEAEDDPFATYIKTKGSVLLAQDLRFTAFVEEVDSPARPKSRYMQAKGALGTMLRKPQRQWDLMKLAIPIVMSYEALGREGQRKR